MKTKKFLPLLLACILVAVMVNGVSKVYASGLTFASVNGNAPLYYIPVTLTNNQDTATPTNFQQQITIDSDANTADYALNLDNVNWQDGAGNILNSWLESGITNTATASVYWINLGSRTIPANGGTLTIYEVIYATSVNCMNTANTGAEPLYTGTYGQYDDGAAVFSRYGNFAGTSLSSMWVNNGMTITVSNGVTQAYTSNTVGRYDDAGLIYNLNLASIGNLIAEFYGSCITTGGVLGPMCLIVSNSSSAYSGSFVQWMLFADSYCIYNNPAGWGGNNNFGSFSYTSGSNAIWSSKMISTTETGAEYNYAEQGSPPYTPYSSSTVYACICSQNMAGSTSVYNTAQWFRIRLYPPNGVMPTVAISAPISTAASNLYVIIIVMVLVVLVIGVFLRKSTGEILSQKPSFAPPASQQVFIFYY